MAIDAVTAMVSFSVVYSACRRVCRGRQSELLRKNSDMSTPKSKNSDNFLLRLNSLMERDRLTKAQLARSLGVSNAHVANWLAGQMPRAEHLLTVARHFGVTMEWLLTGEGSTLQAPPRSLDPPGLKQAKAAAEKLARQLGEAEETTRSLRVFLGL